ncbi:MAG: SUMF1/EgtB/PvdO family nonheme iron enzyme [Desulfobacteraceae bacterium]|nr:SUMF1/EgtB/PvdO family nonheme iron enzyme [Desulfobacteraceae bacterium]
MSEKKKVFISYAREDIKTAKRLYDDLRKAGLDPWMDRIDLLPGQMWKTEVQNAIKKASFFITLISENSVSKEKGFVHKEQKVALELFDELPSFRLFFIPARIDSISPEDERLPERVKEFHWANLFPDYDEGLEIILQAIAFGREPSEFRKPVFEFVRSETVNIHLGDQTNIHSAGDVSYAKNNSVSGVTKETKQTETPVNDKPVAEVVSPSSKEKPEAAKDKERITNSIGMDFVLIKPGTFMMGAPKDEPGRHDDETLYKFTLTKGFYMQTTQVTQGQWKAVMGMGSNPSCSGSGDDYPVENVSWNDTQEFIKKLYEKEGTVYRLPTEAEWEYSCRAGTGTPFYFGRCLSTDQANYNGRFPLKGCPKGEYRGKTTPVANFEPSAWGLYDMHGNVREWCQDWFSYYPSSAVTDTVDPDTGSYRIHRGGSWNGKARGCRSANRRKHAPDKKYSDLGFRLSRDVKP